MNLTAYMRILQTLTQPPPKKLVSSSDSTSIKLLETIWCYVKERNGFTAVDIGILGVPCYRSFAEAVNSIEASRLRLTKPPSGSEAWIRLEDNIMWRHYEFLNGELALVTLMLPWE